MTLDRTGSNTIFRRGGVARFIAGLLGGAQDVADTGTKDDRQEAETPSLVADADFLVSKGARGGHWITHRSDMVIGHALRRDGHFEEGDIDKVLALLDGLGRPAGGGVFLDIGANIGSHSVHAARLGFERVISFEPDPTNFRLLRINALLNGVEDQIEALNAAASGAPSVMVLEISNDNFGDHRIQSTSGHEMPDHYGEMARGQISVAVTSVDVALSQRGIAPESVSLVWIDTQGHEGQVLSGATTLLAAGVPIVIEFWPYGIERSGGFSVLGPVLEGCERIIDLQASMPDAPVCIAQNEIRDHYDRLLAAEAGHGASFRDLLLLP